MTSLTIDGKGEEDFRRAVERALRQNRTEAVIGRLQRLIAPYCGRDAILPARFATITPAEVRIAGWSELGQALSRHDRADRPITALSVSFGWPGEHPPAPDAGGLLPPLIETGYYTDDAFAFSQCDREDLLDGYSHHGCAWTDECEATDRTLSLTGADDLHGALAALEARLLSSDDPAEDDLRAGSLGACLLSALLIRAVGTRIARDGLPRALCVLAGSNGVYPYFDVPVAGIAETARNLPVPRMVAATAAAAATEAVPGPRYSSLLVTGIPRARKRAVLVLNESESDMAVRIAALRGHHHATDGADPGAAAPLEPAPADPIGPAGESWDFRELLARPAAADVAMAVPIPESVTTEPAMSQPAMSQPAVPEPVMPSPHAATDDDVVPADEADDGAGRAGGWWLRLRRWLAGGRR